MKRLNKKQRHKLYKDALDILLSTSENHYFGPIKYNWGNWCICDCIINILNPNCKKYNPEKLQESLCEFNLFKRGWKGSG